MNPSYRRDKDHNYMVLDAPQKIRGNEYQVRMMTGNNIPHLLKCHMRMIDGEAVFFYEITGMQPMFRVFEKTAMNQEDIRNILSGIKQALENVERYLLDGNQLLFEPEYLFLDISFREVYMCCLPFYQGNMGENFRKLTEYLLKKTDHSDEAAVLLGYDVYSKTAEENYCLSEVLRSVYQERRMEKEEIKFEETREENVFEEDFYVEEVSIKEPDVRGKQEDVRKENVHMESVLIGKTDVEEKKIRRWIPVILSVLAVCGSILILMINGIFSPAQVGGVLFAAAAIFVYLFSSSLEKRKGRKHKKSPIQEEAATCVIREGENQGTALLVSLRPEKYSNILLYKDEIHIGKEERSADVCIPCSTVSRIHAKIIRREERYYLTDLGSTNGTCINGKRLAPEESVELETGDLVAFAEAEYMVSKTFIDNPR